MNNTQFKNPYITNDKTIEYGTINFDIGQSDFLFVRVIRPSNSTLSGVCGHLWKKTVEALKRKDINDATKSTEFEQFITTSHLVSAREYEALRVRGLLDSSTDGSVPTSTPPDDGRGETPTRDQYPTDASIVSNIQGKGGKQRQRAIKSSASETNIG